MDENEVQKLENDKRRFELKSQALRERVAEQEDKISELRVELTITVENMEKYISELIDNTHQLEEKVIECDNNHSNRDDSEHNEDVL